jgi:hypothetical protein
MLSLQLKNTSWPKAQREVAEPMINGQALFQN